MKSPAISVIVPVYNVEGFLNRCVDSILSQSFADFEMLLINDGSTDKSGEICDNYAKADYRIRVLRKENGGVTAARRDGVKLAKGEWITFVDGDDSLPPDAFQNLITGVKDDIFMVIGAYHRKCENDNDEFFKNSQTGIFSNTEYLHIFLNHKVEVAPWGKLFRKHLFYDSIFDLPREIKNKEDLIMNLRLGLHNTGKVFFIDKSVYNYTWDRPGSALSVFLKKFDLEYELKIISYQLQALKDKSRVEEFKTELAAIYMQFLWGRKRHLFGIENSHFEQVMEMHKFILKNNKKNLHRLIPVFAFVSIGRLVSKFNFK